MTRPRTLPFGSISEATLRPEDVIPALLDAARSVRMTREDRRRVDDLAREWDSLPDDDPEFIASEVWNDLLVTLQNYAPPFAYVGSHEGDGAAIGVWLSDEALEEAVREGEVWRDDGGKMPQGASYRLVVSDHGNLTLYDRRGREVWGLV